MKSSDHVSYFWIGYGFRWQIGNDSPLQKKPQDEKSSYTNSPDAAEKRNEMVLGFGTVQRLEDKG